MKKPLVSVVIPTHNRAELLAQCLKSVTSQSYNNFEIIVVDDGSTDETAKIVSKIGKTRIRYYYKENSGPSESRNIGIKKSRGKYISFVDDDDAMLPDKLKHQVSSLEKNSSWCFCYTNCKLKISDDAPLANASGIFSAGFVGAKSAEAENSSHSSPSLRSRFSAKADKLYAYITTPPENSYLHLLLAKNFIANSSVMVRKSLLLRVGLFRKKYEPVEDYDLWLRLARAYEFGYVDKILTRINIQAVSASANIHKVIFNDSRIRLSHLKKMKLPDLTIGVSPGRRQRLWPTASPRCFVGSKIPPKQKTLHIHPRAHLRFADCFGKASAHGFLRRRIRDLSDKKLQQEVDLSLSYQLGKVYYYSTRKKEARKYFARVYFKNPTFYLAIVFLLQTYLPGKIVLNLLFKIYFMFFKEKVYCIG